MSWNGVVTNGGRDLLDEWSEGGHTLTIDRAEVGSGLTDVANMRTAVGLAHRETTAAIVAKEAVEGGTKFKILVSPAETTAYVATEIGIWAHLDSQASVLMSLHQDESGGVAVPTRAESPDFAFAMYIVHAISNTDALEVTIDPNAYVSNSRFVEAINVLTDTKLDLDGDAKNVVVTYTSEDAAAPTAWEAITVMSSGKKFSEVLNLLSGAVKNLRFLKTKVDDTKDSKVTFTTGDAADTSISTTTGWSTVDALASNSPHSTLLNRISIMMKNVRFLWKLIGDTDISSLSSQHTITGALSKLNTDLSNMQFVSPGPTGASYTAIENWIKANFVASKWIYTRTTPTDTSGDTPFQASAFAVFANMSSTNFGFGWIISDNGKNDGCMIFRVESGTFKWHKVVDDTPETVSGCSATAGSNITVNNLSVKKSGRLVFVGFQITATTDIAVGSDCEVTISGIRPAMWSNACGFSGSSALISFVSATSNNSITYKFRITGADFRTNYTCGVSTCVVVNDD